MYAYGRRFKRRTAGKVFPGVIAQNAEIAHFASAFAALGSRIQHSYFTRLGKRIHVRLIRAF